MNWPDDLLSPEVFIPGLALCIPIVAIIVGGITAVIKRLIAHRERMAMIEHGIHPDHPPESDETLEEGEGSPDEVASTQTYRRT